MTPHPLEQLHLEPLRCLSGSLEHLVETRLWARGFVLNRWSRQGASRVV